MKQNPFHKSERLCKKKIFNALFSQGKSLVLHPVRMIYLETTLPENVPVQVAFSVSKQRFKKATERNRIKRQMREAWRLNNNAFKTHLTNINKQMAMCFIYTGNQPLEFALLQNKIILLLSRLIDNQSTNSKH